MDQVEIFLDFFLKDGPSGNWVHKMDPNKILMAQKTLT